MTRTRRIGAAVAVGFLAAGAAWISRSTEDGSIPSRLAADDDRAVGLPSSPASGVETRRADPATRDLDELEELPTFDDPREARTYYQGMIEAEQRAVEAWESHDQPSAQRLARIHRARLKQLQAEFDRLKPRGD